jgi:hypothetical protein
MNTKHIAKLLGIKLTVTLTTGTPDEPVKSWNLTCPASPEPQAFSTAGCPVYRFDSWAEVEAFVSGYSLVVQSILKATHSLDN